jgi:hypothetical protein
VVRNITADLFISVGNEDALASESRFLADTATKLGSSVDSLFFQVIARHLFHTSTNTISK